MHGASSDRGRAVFHERGQRLIRALGYAVRPLAGPVSLLLAGPRKVAVAAFLDRSESPDITNVRFSGLSPASFALSRADDEGLDWVIVTAGHSIRLYPRQNIGVGRRGRTETFVEVHLGLPAGQCVVASPSFHGLRRNCEAHFRRHRGPPVLGPLEQAGSHER